MMDRKAKQTWGVNMTEQQMVTFQQTDGAVVARLNCSELTSDIGDELYRQLLEANSTRPGGRFVLDLSALKFIGSIGLSVLVKLSKRVKGSGGMLALAGLHGHCLDVVRVVGLAKALALYPSVQSAIASDDSRAQAAQTPIA
jgi:anti-anti-sigma factor